MSTLDVLKKENLISKDIKAKLMNPPQFQDTLSEIKACCYLISNGIKNVRLSRNFPNIEIPDRNIIIEVKNLHSAQRLLNSNAEVAYLDDIRRIWSKLSEEILPKLENSKINIILFDVPVEVDFDEFEDLFVYSEEITINLQTNLKFLYLGENSQKKEQ